MQAGSSAPAAGMSTVGRSFERLAAICAVAAGVGGFLYRIAFVADAASDSSVADLSSSLLLLITGLLTLVALIGVTSTFAEWTPPSPYWRSSLLR